MPESVKRRGSSGPTTGATVWSAVSLSSMAMAAGYRRPGAVPVAFALVELRSLPAVDALAAEVDAPRPVAVAAARAVLAERRAELLGGNGGDADLPDRARRRAADLQRPALRRVLNATGVIVHTNLGRAPLGDAARE